MYEERMRMTNHRDKKNEFTIIDITNLVNHNEILPRIDV